MPRNIIIIIDKISKNIFNFLWLFFFLFFAFPETLGLLLTEPKLLFFLKLSLVPVEVLEWVSFILLGLLSLTLIHSYKKITSIV